ncbi:MAG: hypothetical protein FK733_02880 [Asgard group archaeon]|nr:hypothetical protein [Asgard group archaeon]
MEKCVYCDNESVGICIRCQQQACKEHLTLLPNQDQKQMFLIEGQQSLDFQAICNQCRQRQKKKSMTVAITIVVIVSLIGIAVIAMRLAGYWFW